MNQHQRLQAAYGEGPIRNEVEDSGLGVWARLRETGWLPYVAALAGVVLFVALAASIKADQHAGAPRETTIREDGYARARANAPFLKEWSDEQIDLVAKSFCPYFAAGDTVKEATAEVTSPTANIYQRGALYQIGLFADRFVC